MKKLVRIGAVLLTVYFLGCVIAGVILAELTLHTPRRALQRQQQIGRHFESAFGANLEDVSLTAADGAVLRGWHARPTAFNGNSVVLLHGVGDNREGIAGYAELFLSRGYAVLLPDSRAHGQSGGALATYGLRESDDVRRWADWLQNRDRANCVYGFGESMGAALVLQSLRARTPFCAVIAESAFSNFDRVARERIGLYLRLGPWFGKTVGRPIVNLALAYTRFRYGLDLEKANPEDAISGNRTPIFLIHGQEDRNILPWHSEKLASAAPNVTLWIVPGARHTGAWRANPSEFDARVLTFFAQHQAVSLNDVAASHR